MRFFRQNALKKRMNIALVVLCVVQWPMLHRYFSKAACPASSGTLWRIHDFPSLCCMPPPESISERLQCQKQLFSIPSDATYLNSAYMGPLPVPVQQAGLQALAQRACPIGITPQDFFTHAEQARAKCAQLANAQVEQVALIPTTAYGIASVARNCALRAGQNIVLLGDQFPSNVYAWRALQACGVELRVVSAPVLAGVDAHDVDARARAWNDALCNAIDAHTAVVAVEHAHWTDGTLFDLPRISQRARQVGAWLVVDATQTMGTLPLDVQHIQPDALIVHSYKSMLCNYGLGFAVFSQRMAGGMPLEQSWLMRAGSEDFARLTDYQDAYAPGMRRYDTSTRANPVLIQMFNAALDLLLAWQPQRVQAYCYSIAQEFVEQARALGLGVASQAHRAANIFGLHLPPQFNVETLRQALAQQKIYVSVRGSALRISPHVYNDAHDFARLARVLHQSIKQ
jgi:selenocysteine lyase/cysteine desulfurase